MVGCVEGFGVRVMDVGSESENRPQVASGMVGSGWALYLLTKRWREPGRKVA